MRYLAIVSALENRGNKLSYAPVPVEPRTANRQHDVGIEDRAIDEQRLAAFRHADQAQIVLVVRIVNDKLRHQAPIPQARRGTACSVRASVVTIEMACGSTPASFSDSTAPRTTSATHGTSLVDRNRHAIARHNAGRRAAESRAAPPARASIAATGSNGDSSDIASQPSAANRHASAARPSPSAARNAGGDLVDRMQRLDQGRLDAGC